MKIDFIFGKQLEEKVEKENIKILTSSPINHVKGLTIFENEEILINLSAIQWKHLEYDMFVKNLVQTIVHENIHLLIEEYYCDVDMNERMCQYLANQIKEESLFKTKNEKFIKTEII